MTAEAGEALIHVNPPEDDFLMIHRAVIRDKRLTAQEVGVLVRLASNREKWTFNAEKLARAWPGMSVRSAETIIRNFRSYGYVHRIVTRQGNRIATKLHLWVPGTNRCGTVGCQDCAQPVAAPSPGSDPTVLWGHNSVASQTCGVTEPSGLIERASSTRESIRSKDSAPDGALFQPAQEPQPRAGRKTPAARDEPVEPEQFRRFWAAYPLKLGKQEAVKAWNKALRRNGDMIAPVILAGIEAQAEILARRERKYIPHASTWLNQRRWEDDPAEMDDSGPVTGPVIVAPTRTW